MGKRNKQKRKREKQVEARGWDCVIVPEFLPDCPFCDSSRRVVGDKSDTTGVIFICQKCDSDFVVMFDGESVPVDDIKNYETGRKFKPTGHKTTAASSVYRVGQMVEELHAGAL